MWQAIGDASALCVLPQSMPRGIRGLRRVVDWQQSFERVPGAAAVLHFRHTGACIDYARTDARGHNIAIDIIPNEIAAECLYLRDEATDETRPGSRRPPRAARPSP
jgi:hypothetical protein